MGTQSFRRSLHRKVKEVHQLLYLRFLWYCNKRLLLRPVWWYFNDGNVME